MLNIYSEIKTVCVFFSSVVKEKQRRDYSTIQFSDSRRVPGGVIGELTRLKKVKTSVVELINFCSVFIEKFIFSLIQLEDEFREVTEG